MKIIFHSHAIEKLKKRNLDKSTIQEGLNNPDRVVGGKYGRKIAQKVYGRYVLRIVYEEHKEDILVITAYLARPQRYLK
ncbi:MAG: DUF4258 domain-containing protein [Candidatus Hydrothermarchaeaceae archaeon]